MFGIYPGIFHSWTHNLDVKPHINWVQPICFKSSWCHWAADCSVEVELMQRARLVPQQEGQGGVIGWGHGEWMLDRRSRPCGVLCCVCTCVVLWLCGESELDNVSYPYWWHHMTCHRREGCVMHAHVWPCESDCEIALSQWVGVRADCVCDKTFPPVCGTLQGSCTHSQSADLHVNAWF